MIDRRAGILLPIASLPSPYGIGDLGPSARAFLTWLHDAGQRIWQVLPLAVADEHGCPYASPSAFALDPTLLSIEDLIEDGWLDEVHRPNSSPPLRTDWAEVRRHRSTLWPIAADRVLASTDLTSFTAAHPWLWAWSHHPASGDSPERAIALQWLVHRQWRRIRRLARALDISIWGDLPFFVGADSADVKEYPKLFAIENGVPTRVSGVPPDAFSPVGQRWGHPQLELDAHRRENFSWWKRRFDKALEDFDHVRIDHFRGFSSVWSIPADAPDATTGEWVPGPGAESLEGLDLTRMFAEDLGIITPPVLELKDHLGLHGMVVLQFAFGPGGEPRYLPHAIQPHSVVYTGTHDNDTLVGWWNASSRATRQHVFAYTGRYDGPSALITLAWSSTAQTAILPMQDLLALPADCRTNIPGLATGNWSWRMSQDACTEQRAVTIKSAMVRYGRLR